MIYLKKNNNYNYKKDIKHSNFQTVRISQNNFIKNKQNTLAIFATHIIDSNIVGEYKKIYRAYSVDSILLVDNHTKQFKVQNNKIIQYEFQKTQLKCIFFDEKIHDFLKLPYYNHTQDNKFSNVQWNNGDYRFYYVYKLLPHYDFYWQIEYDVFCNSAYSWEPFFVNFTKNKSDLLGNHFREIPRESTWMWIKNTDWIYNGDTVYHGVFFPVIRLSNKALSFLYQKRLEHALLFSKSNISKRRWLHCELFVATELYNNDYTCENLNLPYVNLDKKDLNSNRIFYHIDNQLYHPIKIVNCQKLYNEEKKHCLDLQTMYNEEKKHCLDLQTMYNEEKKHCLDLQNKIIEMKKNFENKFIQEKQKRIRIKNSLAWKITYPLRFIFKLFFAK